MDSYGKFAEIYDKLMTDFDYIRWMEYMEEIFHQYNKKPRNILEMACGSGNLTEQLCKRRYNVMAFDLSEEMLLKAQEKIGRKPNVKFTHQNMTNFKYNQKFDAVLSICDSINYLIKAGEFEKTITNVYNHLENEGIFIFDINSEYKLRNIIGENTFVTDENDVFYVWENEIEDDVVNFYINFFVKNEKGSYDRFQEVHKEKIYASENIKNLLLKTGFSKVALFDAFTMNEPTQSTERINIVAIK